MDLVSQVAEAFASGGALSRITEHYQPRQPQLEMAEGVARAIERGEALVVEAGTGVGKTFAYLVPALLSGERVMVSTASKTLQDQLFSRDLPRLVQGLGLALRVALLKGRSSYLCLHRMEQALAAPRDRASAVLLQRVQRWSQSTRAGDLAELSGLDERSQMIGLVTSTRENCLGSQCPQAKACHVNLARREAMAADVLVVNHHLFFADLTVRESGVAELLPAMRVLVFDEAHQLNEIGVQFLGRQLGTHQLLDLARDILGAGLQLARGLVDWNATAGALEHAARELRLLFPRSVPAGKLRWQGEAAQGVAVEAWRQVVDDLRGALGQAVEDLSTVSELSPDFGRLVERAQDMQEHLRCFTESCDVASVRWVEVAHQVRLVESPLDIAHAMAPRLRLGESDADGKAWIFTSATLGDDHDLNWFCEPCGLTAATQLRVGSPFNYPRQAALYVPTDLSRPDDARHSTDVAELVARAARRLGGRTLVLTTTLRALNLVGEHLRKAFPEGSGTQVLIQGQDSRSLLMDRFRQGGVGGPGTILVASASFWQGFDVPGDALQLVVIDKLPFPPPGDPLVEARTQRLQNQGRSAFNDYFMPEAAVALRQGAGRLIRTETDRGLLVLCDVRLIRMGYGRRLLASLPAMRRITSEPEFESALEGLAAGRQTAPATKSSTTAVPPS